MMTMKKTIMTLMLIGTMTMLSGCSAKETLQLFLGHTDEAEEETTQDVFDPEAVQVDTSIEAPVFTKNLKGKAAYAVGEEAKALKVKAEVQGEGKVSYQWYVNTVDSNGGGIKIEGATEASYKPDTKEEGYWYYYVVATNTIGNAMNMTTSEMVKIHVDPKREPAPKEGELKKGWGQDKKGWYYVGKNGKKVAGKWANIDGKRYLFNKKGYRLTGWQTVKDATYYLNEDGSLLTGWFTDGEGKKYYLSDDTGAVHKGWLDGNGAMFYANADGVILCGEWEEIEGSWYYFNEDGVMLSNCEVDGKWLNPDGRLAE